MVTDEEFKLMEERVSKLEKAVRTLQVFAAGNIMRSDYPKSSGPIDVKKRDTTKYIFEDEVYSKRMLVLEIVKRTVRDRKIEDPLELRKIFPDGIQGSLGVVKSARWAEKYSDAKKRFFFKDEDVITLQGQPFVVCSQWDVKNISRFLKVVETLGYNIQCVNYNVV